MRISDWSSDVCSSDFLVSVARRHGRIGRGADGGDDRVRVGGEVGQQQDEPCIQGGAFGGIDRKSVVSGKSVSGRVDLGGRRIIKTQNSITLSHQIYN